jgi:hypothetical protein
VLPKENRIEVNADTSKYVVKSRNQKVERIHRIKNENIFCESVERFTYLGTTLKYENYIQEEIKSRLKSGNVCYHSLQNLLSSSLLSNHLKINIYRTIILPVVL